MIVGRRYVQLAAIWHWYLPLHIIYNIKRKICPFPLLYSVVTSGIDKLDAMVDDTSVSQHYALFQ